MVNIHLLHPLATIEYQDLLHPAKVGIFATEGEINMVFNIVEGALTVLLFT